MSTDPKQTWHVAVGDTASFGALHAYHVEAHSDVEAAFLAGSAARRDHGAVTATWTVLQIESDSDRQAEQEHDAAEAKAQRMHDEMVDSMYADGLIA